MFWMVFSFLAYISPQMQIQPICKNSYALYYAISSDKWTNVKIQFMSRTNCPSPPPPVPSSLLSAGNWEERSPWRYFWQPTTQYHCKGQGNSPPGLVSPWHSVLGHSQGFDPQISGATSLHVAQLKLPRLTSVINNLNQLLRKPFSSLKLRGK